MKTLMLVMSLIFVGCGDDTFKKVEKLDGFRILAIKSNNPEVAPGGTANLEIFVSDPKGPVGGRVISGTTESCIDPGVSTGAEVNCGHDASAVAGTYTIDTTVPDLLNNLFTGFSGLLNVTVPNTILLGRSARQQANGVAYITIFTFTVDGQQITAFKRVIATNRVSLNANPTGSAVLLNGSAFAGTPQKEDKLNLTTSTPEIYSYVNVDGNTESKSEDMDVAWFVSEAEFNKPKAELGEEVKLTEQPPAGPYLIIGIVRDDRGGVDIVRTKVP